ncbi:MAG: hypothetical protein JW839_11130 [Candidatus Lokiarchaeota archaeon]|nr:hypothetical protein [Candidatus Lokiarchaeota archaeon]
MAQETAPFTSDMLKAPKKYRARHQQDQQTLAFNVKYERSIEREDVRSAASNMKKALGAHTIILACVAALIVYTVIFNLNRGDNIFPDGQRVGDVLIIPWGDWHAWLENLSWTIGILAGAVVAIVVSGIATYAHYRPKLQDREMDEFTSASAQAESDIEIVKAFKEKYADLYDDIKEGRVKLVAPAAPASATQPVVIKAGTALPPIKMPPKIAVPLPGMGGMPVPTSSPPPIPGEDGGKKKRPSGPVEGEKKIYVRCIRCEKTLAVGIPRKLVLDNELEVVPVSIVHGEGDQKHVLTVFLDPDFKSRRDRVSDMLVIQ